MHWEKSKIRHSLNVWLLPKKGKKDPKNARHCKQPELQEYQNFQAQHSRPSFVCDTNIFHVIYIVNVWDFMFVHETFSKWNKNHEVPQYCLLVVFCRPYMLFWVGFWRWEKQEWYIYKKKRLETRHRPAWTLMLINLQK